jgi:tRNA 2-thiouridine synthesizing protein A
MDIKDIEPTKVVDVLGRVCPYPLVMAKKATQDLKEGEVVKMLCDSEASVTTEIPNFCKKKGLLFDSVKKNDHWELYIMKNVE